MLLDSNIIIYAAQPQYPELPSFIAECTPAVSVISLVEVLGYHKLTDSDRSYFEEFFKAATILPINDDILRRAIQLRRIRKLLLGDSLMAATALVHNRTLVTRNVKHFEWIADLTLLNPIDD